MSQQLPQEAVLAEAMGGGKFKSASTLAITIS